LWGFCSQALVKISRQQAEDFELPTGPINPLIKAFDL
jgi:hypothetical protein